jgi:hypothetical protein
MMSDEFDEQPQGVAKAIDVAYERFFGRQTSRVSMGDVLFLHPEEEMNIDHQGAQLR